MIGCFHHLQGHDLLANRSVMGNDTEGEWWKGSLDSQREIAEEILTCFPSGPLVNSTPLCHRMYKTFCLLPCMLLTQSQSTWHGISHPRWYFHPAIKIIYKWINITAQRACVFQKYLEIYEQLRITALCSNHCASSLYGAAKYFTPLSI